MASTTKTAYGNLPNSAMSYLPLIEKYCKIYNIPVTVVAWMLDHESKGNPKAWNPNNNENSRGLLQISENAAKSAPLFIPQADWNRLYEPEFNIMNSCKLLDYIRGKMVAILPKDIDAVILWNCVTSSYNQGWGYYKWAIESLTKDKLPLTWDNIVDRVNNPTTTTKKPWYQNVISYAKATVGNIDPNTLRNVTISTGIGLGTILLIGGILYMMNRAKQGNLA